MSPIDVRLLEINQANGGKTQQRKTCEFKTGSLMLTTGQKYTSKYTTHGLLL